MLRGGIMLDDWLDRLLTSYHDYKIKNQKAIDRFFQVMSGAMIIAMGLALMAVPAWDFFDNKKRSKEITPSQQLDYEGLVSVAEDAAVVKAADELFKRDDVGWIWVRRGEPDSPMLQVSLKKPDGNFSWAPQREMGGYSLHVAYGVRGASLESELRGAHAGLSFLAGLFIVLFTLLHLLIGLGPEANANARAVQPPQDPTEPRVPDPTPPAPPPMPDTHEAQKSGLRLVK